MERAAGKLPEVAQALNKALSRAHPAGPILPALFFFTDEERTPDPLPAIAELPEDCGVVFRHYGAPDRAKLAARTVKACHNQGRICLIAADLALALRLGADGLHMPEHMLRKRSKTVSAREGWIITTAAHSAGALKIAGDEGADAAFLSPVFETISHPDTEALGVTRFAELVRAALLPVYALGGVTNETAPQLLGSGAVGIGAMGGLLGD